MHRLHFFFSSLFLFAQRSSPVRVGRGVTPPDAPGPPVESGAKDAANAPARQRGVGDVQSDADVDFVFMKEFVFFLNFQSDSADKSPEIFVVFDGGGDVVIMSRRRGSRQSCEWPVHVVMPPPLLPTPPHSVCWW